MKTQDVAQHPEQTALTDAPRTSLVAGTAFLSPFSLLVVDARGGATMSVAWTYLSEKITVNDAFLAKIKATNLPPGSTPLFAA